MLSISQLMPISLRLAWITSAARFLVSLEQMMLISTEAGSTPEASIYSLAFFTSKVSAPSSVEPSIPMGLAEYTGVAMPLRAAAMMSSRLMAELMA